MTVIKMAGKRQCVIRWYVQWSLIACVIVQAEGAASDEGLSDKLELPSARLYIVALDVCDILDTVPVECVENFNGPPQDVGPPSSLVITGRSESGVEYEITPSAVFQAVLIVSDDGDVIVNTISPMGTQESTYTNSTKNYTFWTTAVAENGTHSTWRQGPKLLAWDALAEDKEYIIQIDVKYGNSSEAQVNFKWNSSEPTDQQLTVTNDCRDTPFLEKVIHSKAGENGSFSTIVPLGEDCQFSVQGLHGKGSKRYILEPQPVQNISVTASPSGDAWRVRVRWARPARAPRAHQVVLRADKERALNVSGNVTEVTFRNVKGQGLYNVSVMSYVGPVRAHAFVRALFPYREVVSSSVPLLSSLLALLLFVMAIVVFVFWCRRRRHSKLSMFEEDDPIDFPEKFFSDLGCEAVVNEDSWEISPEKLQLHEVVGEGAFGVVRRGTLAPDREVAVKMLKDYPSRDEVRSFRAESELMKSVGAHPHVVSLLGCCSGRRPLIVAEYCPRGDLLSYLRCSWDVMVSKRKYYNNNSLTTNYRNDLFKNTPEESKLVVNKMYDLEGLCDTELTYVDLLSFCRQIAMGMEFLASNRLVHRDLAARNVLVTSDRTLKIADFGLSRDIYQENQYKQKGNGKMPVKWMALESLTHGIYTTQSDVWSFGVVMWEVVTVGGTPYADVPPARLPRLLRSGYRMPQPANCCKQLYELMLSCWRGRPRERPTFAELHTELDAMLHRACAEQYLALELRADDFKPDETRSRYARLWDLARGKYRRAECLEPVHTHSNHYSLPPAPPLAS